MFHERAHDFCEKQRTNDVIVEENVTFESLLLSEKVLEGLKLNGFVRPSPIQLKALPVGRCGFDLIIKSKSGTGKTLVFSIIAVESVNVEENKLQVLILVPAREIAVQIESVLKNVAVSIEGLKIGFFIGGLPVEDDIKKIKDCHIAVGAPGRIKHLLTAGALKSDSIELFILDEADKLMDTSFRNDINVIYNSLPAKKQVIASSATYPKALESFLMKYMLSPVNINAEIETPVLLGLKQFVFIANVLNLNAVQIAKAKNQSLFEILSTVSFTQCLIFCNYQTRAESVCNYLKQNNWDCSFTSAAQTQSKRLEAINDLKEFKNRVLISTDLTSRGIDAPNVDIVINYDVPRDAVTYLHRMGRAGRFGSSGFCINLVTQGNELAQLTKILGSIAPKLSISKLPPLEDKHLWKLDCNDFEQIYGTESSESGLGKKHIKDEILSLKVDLKGTSKHSNETFKDENASNLEANISDCDTTKNVNNVYTIQNENCESTNDTALLQSLALSENTENKNDDLEDENKKRKRTPDPIKNEFHLEKKKTDDLNRIFCKNKALLDVTKLLFSKDVECTEESVVDEYLEVLKGVSIEDKEMDDFQAVEEKPSTSQKGQKDIEDLFVIAYEDIIEESNEKWYKQFVQEYTAFVESCKTELSDDDDDDDDDDQNEEYEEQEYEMDYFGTPENETENDISYNKLEWVPVTKKDQKDDDKELTTHNSDHYKNCYRDLSDNLWQNGLTFEDVQSFDEWYYQWQTQLLSVRNYVQQNIYVDEMSNYQQNRWKK